MNNTMKFYIILPIIAFVLIFSNALYGHGVFTSNHPEDISKYSIYVHFQPEWSSHPSNLLFDITNVWNNLDISKDVYYDELFAPASSSLSLDQHNYNKLQYVGQRSFVELKHRFSDCQTNWQPILYRYAIDSLRNQFEIMAGANIDDHPYAIMYPNSHIFKDYDPSTGYVQFIPICTSLETTSYEYSIKTNNDDAPFDVFFVNDISEYKKFLENPGPIQYYENKDDDDNNKTQRCFGISFTSFSGKCENISKDSGLLIWVPDDLDLSLTKITINLREL